MRPRYSFSLVRHLAVVVLTCLAPAAAFGQNLSEKTALEGIKSVYAHVELVWDERITATGGMTEQPVRASMDDRFALELRKLGVEVTEYSTGGLYCEVILLRTADVPLVFYSVTVHYNTYVMLPRGARGLIAPIWSDTWAGVVGQNNLTTTLDSVAKSCAERFGNHWLAANPRR